MSSIEESFDTAFNWGKNVGLEKVYTNVYGIVFAYKSLYKKKKQGKSTYEKTPAPDLSAKIKPVPTIEDKTGYGSVQTRFALLKLDILDLTLFENRI